jgi:hypothetical protein
LLSPDNHAKEGTMTAELFVQLAIVLLRIFAAGLAG